MASPAIRVIDYGLGVQVQSPKRWGHMYFWGSPLADDCLDGQIGANAAPQRVGLGKRLLKKLLALHKRYGCSDKIIWGTTFDNKASIALAQSMGFRYDPIMTAERHRAGGYKRCIVLSKINKRYSTCKPWR